MSALIDRKRFVKLGKCLNILGLLGMRGCVFSRRIMKCHLVVIRVRYWLGLISIFKDGLQILNIIFLCIVVGTSLSLLIKYALLVCLIVFKIWIFCFRHEFGPDLVVT